MPDDLQMIALENARERRTAPVAFTQFHLAQCITPYSNQSKQCSSSPSRQRIVQGMDCEYQQHPYLQRFIFPDQERGGKDHPANECTYRREKADLQVQQGERDRHGKELADSTNSPVAAHFPGKCLAQQCLKKRGKQDIRDDEVKDGFILRINRRTPQQAERYGTDGRQERNNENVPDLAQSQGSMLKIG